MDGTLLPVLISQLAAALSSLLFQVLKTWIGIYSKYIGILAPIFAAAIAWTVTYFGFSQEANTAIVSAVLGALVGPGTHSVFLHNKRLGEAFKAMGIALSHPVPK